MADKSRCSVCGKLKEKRFVNYADIEIFIECECEVRNEVAVYSTSLV